MPALIIILGLAGLIIVVGGYALQELGRPYPEEHDAKRKSKTEAERLQRHAERDAILAHAEIVDQRTKAEIKRQYMREQYPPGTPIPDVPMPELPPDPREAMADAVPDPNLRHRKPMPVVEEPDGRPSVPDTRDLRGALARMAGGDGDEGQGGGRGRAADRSAALRDTLSRRSEQEPDDAEKGTSDARAGLLKSRLAGLRAQIPDGDGEEPDSADGPDEVPDTPDVPGSELVAKRGPFGRKAKTQGDPKADTEPQKPKHGLFGKKPKVEIEPDDQEGPEAEPESETRKPKRGLFGRKAKSSDEPDYEPIPISHPNVVCERVSLTWQKPKRGLFGKKAKPEPDVPAEEPDGTGIPEDADETPAKPKRGLFGRKPKPGRGPEDRTVRPADDAPPPRALADYEPDGAIPDVPDGDGEDIPELTRPAPTMPARESGDTDGEIPEIPPEGPDAEPVEPDWGSGDTSGENPEIVPAEPAQEDPWSKPPVPLWGTDELTGTRPTAAPPPAEEEIPDLPEDEDPDADLEPEDDLIPVEDEE